MILAAALIIGALATYWAIETAGVRGGNSRLSIADVLMALIVSAILSGVVYASGAVWAVLADSASVSYGDVHYNVLHAWLVLVGPVVSLVIVPSAYATANELQRRGVRLSDRWRMYGFPSIVTIIYVIINVVSFLTDPIGGWSEVSLWRYTPLPLHCVIVFASWIVYVGAMDRWIPRLTASRLAN